LLANAEIPFAPEIGHVASRLTDAQFHDSIEVPAEPDCPFKALRPKRLNEFGIPEKKRYRSKDVATALGISTDLLRWRFRKGKYPEVRKDSAGRRMFSLIDIECLANSRLRIAHRIKTEKTRKMPTK